VTNAKKVPLGKKSSMTEVWKTELKSTDIFMHDPRDTDVVIPIIGITGVGKSTFINTFLGEQVAPVGHTLNSRTDDIQHIVVPHPYENQRRLVLIDTPGFDHTKVGDREILRRIAVWLARSYSANMKLAGIIYLHEISQTHMPPVQRNLDMFTKLCGPGAIKNVVLATTKWGDVPKEVGWRREQLLKNDYWKSMLDLGSILYRFESTRESACQIVNEILSCTPLDAAQIQTELVDLNKTLAETEAGRALYYNLCDLLEMRKHMTRQFPTQDDELCQKVVENEHKIRSAFKQIKQLNGWLPKALKRLLKQY